MKNSMAYIRDFYGVPAKRGAIVYFKGFRGVIVGSKNSYLRVRMEDFDIVKTLHPEEVRYGNWGEQFKSPKREIT